MGTEPQGGSDPAETQWVGPEGSLRKGVHPELKPFRAAGRGHRAKWEDGVDLMEGELGERGTSRAKTLDSGEG